jgi:hypothetical protein
MAANYRILEPDEVIQEGDEAAYSHTSRFSAVTNPACIGITVHALRQWAGNAYIVRRAFVPNEIVL